MTHLLITGRPWLSSRLLPLRWDGRTEFTAVLGSAPTAPVPAVSHRIIRRLVRTSRCCSPEASRGHADRHRRPRWPRGAPRPVAALPRMELEPGDVPHSVMSDPGRPAPASSPKVPQGGAAGPHARRSRGEHRRPPASPCSTRGPDTAKTNGRWCAAGVAGSGAARTSAVSATNGHRTRVARR